MDINAVYSGTASTLENQHKSCSTPTDYIRNGKFIATYSYTLNSIVTQLMFHLVQQNHCVERMWVEVNARVKVGSTASAKSRNFAHE